MFTSKSLLLPLVRTTYQHGVRCYSNRSILIQIPTRSRPIPHANRQLAKPCRIISSIDSSNRKYSTSIVRLSPATTNQDTSTNINNSTKESSSINEKGTSKIDYSDRVVVSKIGKDGIVHVELNRPNKLNGLDMKMFYAIRQTIMDLKQDRTVRVIILSGRGKAFCTGLDVPSVFFSGNPLASAQELLHRPIIVSDTSEGKNSDGSDETKLTTDEQKEEERQKAVSNLAQDICYLWRTLDVPVIGVLHGMCYGGGFQLALGTDIRFGASSNLRISIMESKWGLIPDMGITVLIRELNVGIDIIKELTMTARIIDAATAKQYGLLTHLVQIPNDVTSDDEIRATVLHEAIQLANEIIQRSPDAVALTKRLYQETWRASNLPSEQYSLQYESALQSHLLFSWNQFIAALKAKFKWKFLSYRPRKTSY